jgi:hypothetical protein
MTESRRRQTTRNDSHPRPGPEPETIKIAGDWEGAVGQALKKKRPPEGWPKPEKPKKRGKKG